MVLSEWTTGGIRLELQYSFCCSNAGTGTVTGVFTYTVVDNAKPGESQPELV
jgi:hypothetical protein